MRYYRQSSSRDNRDRKCFSHHLAATTPESHGCRRVRWSTSAVKRHQVDSHWQVIIYSGKFSVPFARCRAVDDEYISLVSGKVLCGGQQPLSIQCRGGNLSGKRFELRAAENWAGAPLPRFSTMRDAHRPVRFLRVDRPSPSPGVSEMRGPLRRSSSAEEAFLLGSVLGDGLRATDLPREPAGHRSLPPIRDRETLSPGVSRHGGAQHSGRRQRNTRLGASSPSFPMS